MAKFTDIGGKFGIIYTCNCGWLDRGHLYTRSSRPGVGAASLWNSLIAEQGVSTTLDKRPAYVVSCTQDAVLNLGIKLHPGVTRQYAVRRGLSFHDKAQVGLAILQEVSLAFESLQDSWLARKRSDSGFSEEDLVSNLIAYYTCVHPMIDVDALCKPVSVEASRDVWRTHGAVGQNKNRAFTPLLHACAECSGVPTFPQQFQTLVPATKGALFDDWVEEIPYQPPI